MRPQDVLQVQKPAWESEDVTMLRDMTMRFVENEIVPNYEKYEKQEMVDRELWNLAGENGLLCAAMPEEFGGAGGTYAHEAAIIEALGHGGGDGFGAALHCIAALAFRSAACREPRRRRSGRRDEHRDCSPRPCTEIDSGPDRSQGARNYRSPGGHGDTVGDRCSSRSP